MSRPSSMSFTTTTMDPSAPLNGSYWLEHPFDTSSDRSVAAAETPAIVRVTANYYITAGGRDVSVELGGLPKKGRVVLDRTEDGAGIRRYRMGADQAALHAILFVAGAGGDRRVKRRAAKPDSVKRRSKAEAVEVAAMPDPAPRPTGHEPVLPALDSAESGTAAYVVIDVTAPHAVSSPVVSLPSPTPGPATTSFPTTSDCCVRGGGYFLRRRAASVAPNERDEAGDDKQEEDDEPYLPATELRSNKRSAATEGTTWRKRSNRTTPRRGQRAAAASALSPAPPFELNRAELRRLADEAEVHRLGAGLAVDAGASLREFLRVVLATLAERDAAGREEVREEDVAEALRANHFT